MADRQRRREHRSTTLSCPGLSIAFDSRPTIEPVHRSVIIDAIAFPGPLVKEGAIRDP